MRLLFLLLWLVTFVLSQKTCSQNCKSCNSNAFCKACNEGYELTNAGRCLISSTVQNCQLFGGHGARDDICYMCRPTHRLLPNNTCLKMSDGCLIAGPTGTCSKCMQGAVRNKLGQCSTKLLNCRKANQNMQCTLCQSGYRLKDNRCISNDSNCQVVEPINGLCMICKRNYKLLEYRCVRIQEAPNCYLISFDMQTCYYCKNGYESYYGRCLISQDIDELLIAANRTKCPVKQYYDLNVSKCIDLPFACQKFDYGFMRCVSCQGNNILLAGLCRDPGLSYCMEFDARDPYKCQRCQPKFFLTTNKLCQQFPLFCEQVSNQKCVKCINLFLLNNDGLCQDPNCDIQDPITSVCTKCKASYVRNITTGICKFQDVNCVQKDANQNCIRCKENYNVTNDTIRRCMYIDPNCKLFSDKNLCTECRINYYINSLSNLCIELPFKCLSADSQGNCIYCSQGYALMISRDCAPIVNITNCQIQLPSNPNECQKCKQGFYKDENNVCIENPIFCEGFDPNKRICTKCNRNSTLKNGICYDNYCQYFESDGECIGCKSGYQYGTKGECIPQKNDPNCKQFMNGQCKVCSDRYYFNSAWKCTNVSTLCRTYNPNSGDCTSCYAGYALEEGVCIRESQRVICNVFASESRSKCLMCKTGYTLNTTDSQCYYNSSGCIRKNITTGACTRCLENYLLDEGSGYCIKLLNPQKNISHVVEPQLPPEPTYVDANCIVIAANKLSCETCINRMYYSSTQNKCIAVDQLCNTYDTKLGQCLTCYPSYSLIYGKCVVTSPTDPQCKVPNPNNSKQCIECYSGYYFDKNKGACVVTDPLCKEINVNGLCLTCWNGYSLTEGKCVEVTVTSASTDLDIINSNVSVSIGDVTTANDEAKKNLPKYCEIYDPQTKSCIKCKKGAAFDLSSQNCEYPLLGFDLNCSEYHQRLCTKCKDNFQLKSKRCIKS